MRLFLVLCAVVAASVASPVDNQGRMIGGNPAAVGQFWHQASIRDFENTHVCGGWIHAARWIITAAHCVIDRTIADTQVIVGATQLSTGGYDYQLSRIIPHPNFNTNTMDNNLALLETIHPIDFYPGVVQAIRLGTADIRGTTTGFVAGWGESTTPGQFSDSLQWLSQSTLTNEDCRARHSVVYRDYINERMICTNNQVGAGMCAGDGGNALVSGGVVIGAASFGYGGCGMGYPDVFTRISSHVSWITGIVNAN